MVLYLFECRYCNTIEERWGSMADPPQPFICCVCGKKTFRIYGNRVDAFKPFVDIHTTGKPVPISSREEREKFCDEHNVTYDSCRYHRKASYKPAADTISYDDYRRELQENGPGTPYRGKIEEDSADIGSV